MSKSKAQAEAPKVAVKVVNMTAKKAKEILGFREAKEGEKGVAITSKDGTKRYMFDNNTSNRPFSLSLAKQYAEQMLKGEWSGQWNSPAQTGEGDSWTIDYKGHIVSCAHRSAALIIADFERERLVAIGADEKIADLGCTSEIVLPDVVLVTGVDPLSADNTDTGKSRSLGDVLFRRGEFASKDYTESDLKGLATALSVAVRHVWLRSNGYRVKGAPKLYHAEAVAFLQAHPLLKEATVFIYKENKGDKDNKKPIDKFGFSLGYAAAHLYLAAFKDIPSQSYLDGSRDMSRRPNRELWDKAEAFWQAFAQVAIAGKSSTPPIVWETHKVLAESKDQKQVLDRDAMCCVVTRAMLAYLDDEKATITTNKLRAGLINSKQEADFTPTFERFGGLDLERSVLTELGYNDDPKALGSTGRQSVDGWKVGDTLWVVQPATDTTEQIAWFGTLKELSDDGVYAQVYSAEDDATFTCQVSWLQTDEPEAVPVDEEIATTE
jgi:hypothetical protein